MSGAQYHQTKALQELYEQEESMSRHVSGSDFKQPPTGNHVGRTIRLVDLGTQHGEYMGQPTSNKQVLVTWELPNRKMEDGKPFTISKFYNCYLSEKATLRKDLENWRGRAFNPDELKKFDLEKVLGRECMLSAVDNGKGKTVVASVSGMPEGVACPPAVSAPSSFWIDEWDEAKFQALPDGLKKLIMKSDEYQARHGFATIPATKPATKSDGGLATMPDDIPQEPDAFTAQFKDSWDTDDVPF